MSAVSNIYLIIFLPLISSILCQLLSKKFLPFSIALSTCGLLIFFISKAFLDVLAYKEFGNEFESSIISLALEFKIDIVSIVFLSLVVFLKTIILFYYRSDIEESLNEKAKKNFYSVYLLSIFALLGIFTTNNLLNLFLFLEIYAFSFFAISAISSDKRVIKSLFQYFSINSAASLLTIFCFLVIYLTLGEVNFDNISEDMQLVPNLWFLEIIFTLLLLSFVAKFFPFQLHLRNFHSVEPCARFLSVHSLFIKSNVGIFVILKLLYVMFGNVDLFKNLDLSPLAIFISLILIFYSAIQIYQQRNLKMIALYFCLNNLGFILACIALKTTESMQSLLFYSLNFSLVNLFIFIFSAFLERHFDSSEIDKIYLIKEKYLSLALPIKLLLLFIAAFPLSILFFANWYLAYAALGFGFEMFLLVALIVSNFAQVNFVIKIFSAFSSESEDKEAEEMPDLGIKKYQFYLLSFWIFVIAAFALVFAAGMLNVVSLNFALSFAIMS
jgi:multicomponent Na+:H+ antiporter subunit D